MTSTGKLGLRQLAFLLSLIVGLLVFASDAFAQQEEDDYYDSEELSDEGPPETETPRFGTRGIYGITATARITPQATKQIGDGITDSYAFCDAAVPDEYLASCLADQLKQISEAMAKTGEYSEAQVILAEAAVKMQKLVEANRDPQAPRLRVQGRVRSNAVRSRPLTPVRKAAVPKVNAAAAKILEEAETKLLRSAEASDRRLIAYAQMARAVGSNKVLLRSA